MTQQTQLFRSIVRPLPRSLHRRCLFEGDDAEEGGARLYSQGALALTYALDNGLEAAPRSAALSLVTSPSQRSASIPDPGQWAGRFLQAVVEVVANDRPLSQLARWTEEHVYAEIGRRRERVAAHRRPGQARAGRQQVATVHICQSSPGSAELAARISMGGRSRAVAARLDYLRDRWVCTAICFG